VTKALRALAIAVTVVCAGCVTPSTAPPPPAAPPPPTDATPWRALPGWADDNLTEAWGAYLASCRVLVNRGAEWRDACTAAAQFRAPTTAQARAHFEMHFMPHALTTPDGERDGLMTGYYEPILRGSRTMTARYRYPLYAAPRDLTPGALYYERARIEAPDSPLRGREIFWVEDAIELFFLHVQGSGRIALETSEIVRVGFAAHNGHPYRSIGRLLIERGELKFEEASMQGIKAWAARNPDRLKPLLDSNPRYVFFRELPPSSEGPPGALGVPLTARRSLAVDPQHIALGAPLYIATTWPATQTALNRLMLAQDTGGAITGPLRTDFYWGTGEEAAREAGRMRQRARLWLLLPKGMAPPAR
jgi:membrane-bound lytic murein transglycosylase A